MNVDVHGQYPFSFFAVTLNLEILGVCGSLDLRCVVDRLVNPRTFGVLYPQYAENLDAIIPQVPAVQRKSNLPTSLRPRGPESHQLISTPN